MRKETYETEIVATAKNILCCKCTCQCGAEGTERVVDVHTMVPLYLLSILLMEDLAEHLLISLAARISGAFDADDDVGSENNDSDWMWSVSEWSDDDIKIMKENIGMLMEAAGELVTSKQITEKSLPELLQVFVVGTERRKEWKQRSKRPPKPSELGPISEIQFMSTAKRAKLLMHQVGKENDNAGADENPVDERSQTDIRQHSPPEPNQFAVDYARVVALMKTADCFCDQSMIVGHRLLLH